MSESNMENKTVSVVRDNLLNRPGYTPYCGEPGCTLMWRTRFDGEQFVCLCGKWRSGFESEFIQEYKNAQGLAEEAEYFADDAVRPKP